MTLHTSPLLFEFEIKSSENLTYIPMCVRFNLDRCRIRLTLLQWQVLPHAERGELTAYPLTGACDAVGGFATVLAERLAAAEAGVLVPATDAPDDTWTRTDQVPAGLLRQCELHHLAPIAGPAWDGLPAFQRYVLVKLSRRTTANHDFLSALREFGLLDAS